VNIALVEDDPHQQELMEVWLATAQHATKSFSTGQAFIGGVTQEHFDLLIIDWMLPDINGDKVLVWVREHLGWNIPVLFITARDQEEDIIKILKLGADDYMTKPVKHLEMLARIEALGRRAAPRQTEEPTHFNRYLLDTSSRTLYYDGAPLELTQKEFELATYLLKNSGRLLSRVHLLESVWGLTADVDTRTVDTHISRIRKKLQLTPENGWRLTPVYGYGYRLEAVPQIGAGA